jgi:hypothetical protein
MSVSVTGSTHHLDFAKVLTEGLGVVGRNFGPFFILALLLEGIPSALIAYAQLMARLNPIFAVFGIVGFIACLITIPMMQAALVYGSMGDLEGRPASTTDCLAAGQRYWLRLLGLDILVGLGVIVGMILLIVPGVLLALRWSLAIPALVLEGRGIQESMGRSAALTQDRRLWIFVLGLILLGAMVVLQIALTIVGFPFGSLHDHSAFTVVTTPLVNTCTSVVVYPVFTALFRQLRADKEGGSPEVLNEVFA